MHEDAAAVIEVQGDRMTMVTTAHEHVLGGPDCAAYEAWLQSASGKTGPIDGCHSVQYNELSRR